MRVDYSASCPVLRDWIRAVLAGYESNGSAQLCVRVIVCRAGNDAIRDEFQKAHRSGARHLVLLVGEGMPAAISIALLQMGAADVISGGDLEVLAEELSNRLDRIAAIDTIVCSAQVQGRAVGRSAVWQETLSSIADVAAYSSAACLLTGESGCGKEVLARLIHDLDPRRSKARCAVLDCTTLRPELAGSELFGHAKGAFTHAVTAREGAVAQAEGGTLFVDEIGELEIGLQAQLLRLMQERLYKRVGEDNWRTCDFRLVCATNRDLEAEVSAGRFRHDLYFRISQSVVRLPPLRERREDIPLLIEHFMDEACGLVDSPRLSADLAEVLCALPLPGNVRELRNLVHRMAARQRNARLITLGALPEEYRHALVPPATMPSTGWAHRLQDAIDHAVDEGLGLREIGLLAEEAAIRTATARCQGSIGRAAERLRVTPRTLQLRRARSADAPGASEHLP